MSFETLEGVDFRRPLLTVTASVDGDVLHALATAEAWSTVGRLAVLIDRWSPDGVRKSLARLVAQGVVDTEAAGPAVLYRLNREHLASKPIIGLANVWSKFLERLTESIGRWPTAPVLAAIFGSAARGDMTSTSDIDIFLVRPTAVTDDVGWDRQVRGLEVQVSRWTGNDVRILQMTDSHLLEHACDELVLDDVSSDGVPVVGDLDWLRRLVKRARLRVGS